MKASALFVTIAPLAPVAGILIVAAPAPWGPTQLAGFALLVPSFVLLTMARIQLGNSFTVTPQATKLVTHGLYARIRNPVYVFGTLFFAGLLLYADRPWFLLCLVPVVVMQSVRAGREAKVLEERFGDAYREYRARTWF